MDTFPNWTFDGKYHEIDDATQTNYAVAVAMKTGFDLPNFDLWAAALPECGLKQEMRERRKKAIEAVLANNKDAAFRHLEWMLLRQKGEKREQGLLPMAKRGQKVTKGASKGGKTRAKWSLREHEMQADIDAVYAEDPTRSYEHIKRIVTQRKGFPESALKRYTTNPKRK